MTGRQRYRYVHQQRGYTQDHLQNVSHFHLLKQIGTNEPKCVQYLDKGTHHYVQEIDQCSSVN